MKRLMYIECKGEGLDGPGRIGWVELSKSRRTFHYAGKQLQKTKSGHKHNCFDADTGENYWVSGPKKNGKDKLYGGVVEIDEDARLEYWTAIRKQPENAHLASFRA